MPADHEPTSASKALGRSEARVVVVALLGLIAVLLALRPLLIVALGTRLLALEAGAAAFVSAVFQFRAARSFARGDYLRRAYLAQGATYVLAVLLIMMPAATTTAAVLADAGGTLAINIVMVTAVWMFARVFAAVGLELPGGRARKVAVVVVVVLCAGAAVALAYAPMARAAAALAGGDLGQLTALISVAGDLATFVLLAPLLLTALALRGGVLVWPWAFFTAASACWLVSDALGLVAPLVGSLVPDASRHWLNLWPVLASLLAAAAAHAQRRVVARPRARST